MLCIEIVSDIQNKFCTQHVLPMLCKKKSFWQRFACTYTTKIAKPLLWSGVMSLGNRFSPQKGVLIYRTLFINWSWGWRRQKYGYISEHDKEVHITCIFWKESRIWLIFMHVIKRMVKIKPYCPSKKFLIWIIHRNIMQNNS